MKSGELEYTIEQQIKLGKTHQQVFDELVTADTAIDIHRAAEAIRRIPTLEKRREYKQANFLLILGVFLFLFSATILPLLMGDSLSLKNFPSLGSCLLLYGVIRYKYAAYMWLIIVSSAGALYMFIGMLVTGDWIDLLSLLLALSVVVMSWFLLKKLSSDYTLDRPLLARDPQVRPGSIVFRER